MRSLKKSYEEKIFVYYSFFGERTCQNIYLKIKKSFNWLIYLGDRVCQKYIKKRMHQIQRWCQQGVKQEKILQYCTDSERITMAYFHVIVSYIIPSSIHIVGYNWYHVDISIMRRNLVFSLWIISIFFDFCDFDW